MTRIDAGLDFRWRHWWLETHFRTRTRTSRTPISRQDAPSACRSRIGYTHRKGITSRWWTGNTRSLAATILDIVERRLSYRDRDGLLDELEKMEVNKWRRTGNPETSLSHDDVQVRNLIPQGDLPVFFENQCDPEANYMAAFTARDPSDRAGFQAFWGRILTEPKIVIRTILFQGEVAGNILRYKHGRRRECE